VRIAGRPKSEAVMIGDGLATDLAAANALGIPCIVMLTGVTTPAQVDALPADRRPAALASDAAELAAALEARDRAERG
jgi:glycerol-1-phosphatase